MNQMIIEKEMKSAYDFIKRVYSIFSKVDEKWQLLYMADHGRLIYGIPNMSGSLTIQKNNLSIMEEWLDSMTFYELLKLPQGSYMIRAVYDVSEDKKQRVEKINELLSSGERICDLSSVDKAKISKLTRISHKYISDSKLGIIQRFGDCEVFIGEHNLMLKRVLDDEKENAKVYERVLFDVESVEEHTQQQMNVDGEV